MRSWDVTGANTLHFAGSAWHDIAQEMLDQVQLQRDTWTGLIVPQQV